MACRSAKPLCGGSNPPVASRDSRAPAYSDKAGAFFVPTPIVARSRPESAKNGPHMARSNTKNTPKRGGGRARTPTACALCAMASQAAVAPAPKPAVHQAPRRAPPCAAHRARNPLCVVPQAIPGVGTPENTPRRPWASSQERAEGFGGEAGLPKNRDERAGRKRPVPVDGDRDVLAGRTDEADVAARLAFDGEAGALEGADASGPLGGLTWRVRGRRRFRRAPRPGAGAVRPARPCPPG